MTCINTSPTRPRRASASRRRRRTTQLAYHIRQLVPGASRVSVVPVVWTDASGYTELVHAVTVYATDGRFLPKPSASGRQIVHLLQGAYPSARWDLPLTWSATTARIAVSTPYAPAELGWWAS